MHSVINYEGEHALTLLATVKNMVWPSFILHFLLPLVAYEVASYTRDRRQINGEEKGNRKTRVGNRDRLRRSVSEEGNDHSRLVKTFDFSADNDQKQDSNGEYTSATLNAGALPESFTVCSAFMVEAWTLTTMITPPNLFTFLWEDGRTWGRIVLKAGHSRTEYRVKLGPVKFVKETKSVFFPLQWTHVCFSIDLVANKVVLVVDGAVLAEEVYKRSKNIEKPVNITLVVGLDSYNEIEFTGKVSEVNLFNPPLSPERMIDQTAAGGHLCGTQGDLVSWEGAEWTLHSQAKVIEVNSTWEGPCRKESQVQVFDADFKWHHNCMHHCQKIVNGTSPSVISEEEWKNFMRSVDLITPDRSNLPDMWLSATEGDKKRQLARLDHWQETEVVKNETKNLEAKETIWRDFYTGQRLDIWTKPYINADHQDTDYGDKYNCMIVLTGWPWKRSWLEWECKSHERSCPCSYPAQPLLRMRGLCSKSLIYWQFTPKQLPGNPGEMIILGHWATRIEFDETTSLWILTDAMYDVTAVSSASEPSYLLGKHEWTISNDTYQCGKGKPYSTMLKLTGCNPVGEFTCDDGQCVKMEERCNQVPDCRDKSDETGCRITDLKNGYNMNIPPVDRAKDGSAVPANVSISLTLMKVVDIDERDHSIQLQFQIRLTWKENRVKYQNLKKKTSLNALTDKEIKELWLPLVIYDNTDQKDSTRLGDGNWEWSTRVSVVREGNFTRSGIEEVDEAEVFEGSENTLMMTQTYTREFQCKYLLQKYPFDTKVPINSLMIF